MRPRKLSRPPVSTLRSRPQTNPATIGRAPALQDRCPSFILFRSRTGRLMGGLTHASLTFVAAVGLSGVSFVASLADRKSGLWGKRGSLRLALGGRRNTKKKK